MRKLLVLLTLLAAFAWCQNSYGMGRVFVFKGTIKASKTIFDVNDTNNLTSATVNGYWLVETVESGDEKGNVLDSSVIVYNSKDKYYKVIPDSITMNPYDPCHVVLLSFSADDAYGEVSFDVVGKGQRTKYFNGPGGSGYWDFIPRSLKGTGLLSSYDFFDPNDIYSGPVTVSLKLDSKWTRHVNTASYNDIDEIADEIVAELTAKGSWIEWPHNPAP
ncbi:MAG: hypothetical protein JW749_03080 [Sedimentisphaerales bacterium]|nr:hypothetical protein [Sedimentisphaerales bacterium]